MVFPILNLPSIVLQQVLGGLTSSELFEMHQCSDITKQALNQYEKLNKTFKTSVDFQRNYVDIQGVQKFYVNSIDEAKDPEALTTKRVFGDQEVPVDENDEKAIMTYWPEESKVEGTEKIAGEFVKSLGLGQFDQILISEDTPAKQVYEWIRQQKIKIRTFDMIGTSVEDKDEIANLIYSDEFLRKVTHKFVSMLECSKDFTPSSFPADKSISMFQVILHHSHWFTGRHLKAFNSGCIVLYHSALKNEELNEYCLAWKSGNYSNLTYLSVSLNDDADVFDVKKIIKGLADEKIITTSDEGETLTITRGGDEKTAEFTVSANKREFKVWIE